LTKDAHLDVYFLICHHLVSRSIDRIGKWGCVAKNLSIEELVLPTANRILVAVREVVLEFGFAALSTRAVADRAGVPLSQIHYHFGSKEQMILAMLREENDSLVKRQAHMFALDLPLAERWSLACDYLDDDLDSGYVRVLQEMMAAGWSSVEVRDAVDEVLAAWSGVLTEVVEQGRVAGANFGAFETADIVALVMSAFLGAESLILLGLDRDQLLIRGALRRVGDVLAALESRR
jgi:AcrR family transcriptional regulator